MLDDKVIEEQVIIVESCADAYSPYSAHMHLLCCDDGTKKPKDPRYRLVLRVNLNQFAEDEQETEPIIGRCRVCKREYKIDKETVEKIKEKYDLG